MNDPMNLIVRQRRTRVVTTEDEFRLRVDRAVEHAEAHLDEWRAEFARRPGQRDRVVAGLTIAIRDGRREHDTVIPMDADDFEAERNFVQALAVRGDLVDAKLFGTPVLGASREPRLIERVPYIACRFDTASKRSHVLIGAISREALAVVGR